ncbi:MAG: hypothetical protein Q9183_000393 [Haloplaca sp. 2 TL-2023]
MKTSYDVLGEKVLDRLNTLYPPQSSAQDVVEAPEQSAAGIGMPSADSKPHKRDLYLLLRDHALEDEVLERFWKEVNNVPQWVCWNQIERGQEVFYRYGGPALTGLAFQSLLGGMVNSSEPSLCDHADDLLRERRELSKHLDVQVATIGTFSASLLFLSLPRQGIWLRRHEMDDYIALFRYVAYLTGTPNEFFESPLRAKRMMETLLRDEIDPSETSQILASNILSSLEGQPPTFSSRSFLEANCRWLNGNELCDKLGIGRPSLYYWALMAGQVLFFMTVCYTYRAIPSLDRQKIAAFRRIMWKVIVEDEHGLGGETVFDFKHIPALSKTTKAEKGSGNYAGHDGIEKRNLRAFLIGCGLSMVLLWIALRSLGDLWSRGAALWNV